MKKRLLSLLLLGLLLALLLPTAALAAAETPAVVFPYVLDNAGLLRDSQRQTLEEQAAELSRQHGCSAYIVTVDDYSVYNSDVYEAAKGIFQYYELGAGAERDGVILLLSMNDRDYAFAGHGPKGETICGYESSWIIEDTFLDNFRNNDWNGGFRDYLNACDERLTLLENGGDLTAGADILTGPDGLEYHAYNYPGYGGRGLGTGPKLAIVVVVPLLLALIVCTVFRAQMRTAKEKTEARDYLVPHSMELRVRQDAFTHRTETRTRIESDSGSRGGGGGSSFHSGGGFSGRSGKF